MIVASVVGVVVEMTGLRCEGRGRGGGSVVVVCLLLLVIVVVLHLIVVVHPPVRTVRSPPLHTR